MKGVLVDTNGQRVTCSAAIGRRARPKRPRLRQTRYANSGFKRHSTPVRRATVKRPTGGSQLLDELPAAGRCARARRRCLSRLSLGLRSRRL